MTPEQLENAVGIAKSIEEFTVAINHAELSMVLKDGYSNSLHRKLDPAVWEMIKTLALTNLKQRRDALQKKFSEL